MDRRSPGPPRGEAAKQWLKDLYQQNKLVRNEWHLEGRRVDLGNIRMPVLNVYAKDDHIVPAAISACSSGGRSQGLFAHAVASFLERRGKAAGGTAGSGAARAGPFRPGCSGSDIHRRKGLGGERRTGGQRS